jgi:hypothetical protein
VWPCPIDEWLLALTHGWRLQWIVRPMHGYHGTFAVLLERDVRPSCMRSHPMIR